MIRAVDLKTNVEIPCDFAWFTIEFVTDTEEERTETGNYDVYFRRLVELLH